jgi:hypothetical protein
MRVTAAEKDGSRTSTRFINVEGENFVEFIDIHIKHIDSGNTYELSPHKECGYVTVEEPKVTPILKQNRMETIE